jgi:hypothetical protein
LFRSLSWCDRTRRTGPCAGRRAQKEGVSAGAHMSPNGVAGVWHDCFNAADVDAVVRVEVTAGERFAHMIDALFGLARDDA